MTEAERLAEIAEIAKNQLSHWADKPPPSQVTLHGERVYIKETPVGNYDELCTEDEDECSMVVVRNEIRYYCSGPPKNYGEPHIYLRDWTIG